MPQTAPKPARVTQIKPERIEPNPHNPRILFDDEPMRILEESIRKLGILVPLDVYPKNPKKTDPRKDRFVLLDGERRWKCARKLEHRVVPVIIVEQPDDERNILTMFHIHNVREGWQLMPTALKLQELMDMLDEQNERKLAWLTKLTISTIRRCKSLLTYPEKHQSMMLAPPSERYKADFFIDLNRFRLPARQDRLEPWIKRRDSRCVDIMIRKYDDGVIRAVTEFRDLASLYRGAQHVNRVRRFIRELDRFLSNHEMRISDMNVPEASFEKEIKEIGRSCKRMVTQLRDVDLEVLATDQGLIESLRKLAKLIDSKLENAMLSEMRDRG
ncbi:MAG: ParB/RepB/Spo0J family partition protein [Planctomycetota bacterium]|jgi:ParB/RepB/Spo0J family partition protein